MKIGIMGLGFVGGATKKVLEPHHELYCYDPKKEKYNDINVLKNAEIILLCVPTPMNEDGSENLSYIFSAIKSIKSLKINPIIVIRSTVEPGTCDKIQSRFNLKVSHNPEFLTEIYAYYDMISADKIIIGGDENVRNKVEKIYIPIFPKEKVKYIHLENKESELLKLTINSILATQVACFNEIYNICKNLNIDYKKIKDVFKLDKRIGSNNSVPGPDGKLGFGGHCLPKDINALIYFSELNGYVPTLFKNVWNFNKKQRK